MTQKQASETHKNSHKLSRANLQVCSTCGKFIATTYRETAKGELAIEELELDVKILSSPIGRLRTAKSQNSGHREQSSDSVMRVEDTCW